MQCRVTGDIPGVGCVTEDRRVKSRSEPSLGDFPGKARQVRGMV